MTPEAPKYSFSFDVQLLLKKNTWSRTGQSDGCCGFEQRCLARRRLFLSSSPAMAGKFPTEHSEELCLWFWSVDQQRGLRCAAKQASRMLDSLRTWSYGTGTFKYFVPPCWSNSSGGNNFSRLHAKCQITLASKIPFSQCIQVKIIWDKSDTCWSDDGSLKAI